MAGSSKRVRRRVAVKNWHAKALQLRIDGYTIRDVAKKLGKAISTVHEAIEKELNEIPAAQVDQLREIDGARLEAVIRGHLSKARRGDAEAAHVVVAAIRQRARLFGTEAPKKTEHTGKDGGPFVFDLTKLTDEQLDRLVAGDTSVLASDNAASAQGAGEGGEASS